MFTDYSFFAMLFVIATSLAPADSREVVLENVNHADQRITFTRGDDGRWALHVNQREVGHLERSGDGVFHHTGLRSPDNFPLAELVGPVAPRRNARQVRLGSRFSPAVLDIERSDGEIRIVDSTRRLLMTPLRLGTR